MPPFLPQRNIGDYSTVDYNGFHEGLRSHTEDGQSQTTLRPRKKTGKALKQSNGRKIVSQTEVTAFASD